MNRKPLVTVALMGAAVAAAAVGPGGAMAQAPAPQPDPYAFEVVSTRLFADTAGAGKGTLLARVKARYRYSPASAGERWYGVTTVTLRGQGGAKTVRDVDRLVHPASGQMVDHRVVLGPREARRILGARGLRAKVRVIVRGHMEMRGVARESGAVSSAPGGRGSNGGAGGSGGSGGLFSVAPVAAYPPSAQSWGNYTFWVAWTNSRPYRPYAMAFYVAGYRGPFNFSIVLQPDYDGAGNPTSGLIGPDGRFRMVSTAQANARWCPPASPGLVTGQVPTPGPGGAFPAEAALVSWSWSGLAYDCGGSQSVADTLLQRDPAG